MVNKKNIENPIEPKEVKSYINYLTDEDGIVWMEAGWNSDDESIDIFAHLLCELHSGELMFDSLEFIKSQCNTPEQQQQYHKLLIKLNDLFFAGTELEGETFIAEDRPVVSPTQVFPQ